jgi:hypothetical protein
MGRQPRRGLDDAATRYRDGSEIPEHLRALAGPFGPWIQEDRLEFHHLNKDVQEWLTRMSPVELADTQDAVSDFVRRRTIRKWLFRITWGAITGFGAVYAAGEKLLKFVQWIGAPSFDPTLIGRALKGLMGL